MRLSSNYLGGNEGEEVKYIILTQDVDENMETSYKWKN